MKFKLFTKNLRLVYFLLLFFSFLTVSAQNKKTVSGTVISSEDNFALPGASIIEKGTNNGTSTDFDGNFSLNVSGNATTLIVSYIGFVSQEVTITNSSLSIIMQADNAKLDEIVVVGYGTQKKSVVTGAISSVKAKDIENIPNGRIEQALQGKVSGLTIAANAGQPGSASTIRIRGITTFTEAGNDPLWVVDGVIVDNGGIGYVNQSDIESMEVLKDAASLAIYGARAAGGVILVTTKKGKSGKISVNYNGFAGVSSPARKLNLLNATQYAVLMNEQSVNGGGEVLYANPTSYGKGTDWQDAIFTNSAQRYSHELSLAGGNDVSSFYASVGIQDQEGIVTPEISSFNKKSMRLNSTHKLSQFITVGQTLGYSHQKTLDIGNTNAEQGGPLSSALHLDPITPLVETDAARASGIPYAGNDVITDANGNPYGISTLVQNNMTNPLAYVKTRLGNHNWSDDFVGNANIEITPIEGLTIKSTLGAKLAYWGFEGFTPVYYLNGDNVNDENTLTRTTNKSFGWNLENTVSYTTQIKDHNLTVLIGQGSYVDNDASGSTVTYRGLPTSDYRLASFGYEVAESDKFGSAYTSDLHKLTSLFSRLNYNYKEKYLVTGVIRRDGSSRFGTNHKFGVFPSFSAGWVLSKEDFWKDDSFVNTIKIRGGYGVTGNDAIGDFGYLALVSGGRNYPLGTDGTVQIGTSPDAPSNPDLKWEETIQTNIGIDARFFNTLNVTAEVYKKKTTGILQNVEISGFVGASGSPLGNIADMENRGIELELGYTESFNKLNVSISGNISYLENEVTYLGQGKTYITGGVGFQSMGTLTRTEVGMARNTFYGFKTAGIFQNQSEIESYTNSTGIIIQPNAKPGDFRWVDTDGNGTINDLDKQYLGSPIPKYTFGFNFNLDYEGFDLGMSFQGSAGNKIFQGLRRIDLGANPNYQTKALARWTGEGTSNSYPRLTTADTNLNFTRFSDFYLEDGDYLRLKLVQFGYTLPKDVVNKIGAQKLRLYVTGENLLTFTKYTGFDPEIGGSTFGIDRGYYPQAQSVMLGANIQF
ncbi:TonB-linked SusC/RagA family outer membrane protein [Mariniflexile fucanivorans]|uniref:TonB-linked SusC/RagA family outer membrane protein n=1 Tax=Mariniflexile fucanivorans TaxID=264023 RepID=A0A4R1RL51_9FLAO|nr:TonB-dependent receptor [Mariniflexile fucanivorans]TCL66941.1 TonB-linked SusC/RagA family outer membrane protein [Mariniflexile fucanivorans]